MVFVGVLYVPDAVGLLKRREFFDTDPLVPNLKLFNNVLQAFVFVPDN